MTRTRVLCAVGLLVVTGCGRSGTYPAHESDGSPTPTGTPLPEAGFSPDTGDGHHGGLAIGTYQIVDLCVPLVLAEGKSAQVASPHPFASGDRIFLHQVQDAVPRDQGSPLSESLAAGRWTIARVASLAGGALALDEEVARFESTAAGKIAQACLAPEHTTIEITGSIAPRDWDGSSGGVLVFFASESATLNEIDASTNGFRGGDTGPSSFAQPTEDDVPAGDGGGKGEGVNGASFALYGRGSLSTDGGGGNGRSAGGGGGGSGGAGGIGGKASDESGAIANLEAGGRGGRAIDVPLLERAILGGGGGAGQQDDGGAGEGGWGGGIVLVFAETFTGPLVVHADGEDGEDSGSFGGGAQSEGDGAGGGGAGGSVLLWSRLPSTPTSVYVSAYGGDGGSSYDEGSVHSGPGGGGGGGVVHLERIANPTIDVTGGANGISMTGMDAWGSTAGATGVNKLVVN